MFKKISKLLKTGNKSLSLKLIKSHTKMDDWYVNDLYNFIKTMTFNSSRIELNKSFIYHLPKNLWADLIDFIDSTTNDLYVECNTWEKTVGLVDSIIPFFNQLMKKVPVDFEINTTDIDYSLFEFNGATVVVNLHREWNRNKKLTYNIQLNGSVDVLKIQHLGKHNTLTCNNCRILSLDRTVILKPNIHVNARILDVTYLITTNIVNLSSQSYGRASEAHCTIKSLKNCTWKVYKMYGLYMNANNYPYDDKKRYVGLLDKIKKLLDDGKSR